LNPDTPLLERLRSTLTGRSDVVEKRMVGGRSFIVGGHLCLGVSGGALMVRIGPEAYARALAEPDVRPLTLGAKHPLGYVLVDPPGIRSDADLARWMGRGLDFVETLAAPKAPPR
jgi:hypothetical protein